MNQPTTPLSEKLGLKYPIVLSPLFIVSNKEMIIAAAEAGVLGSMPSINCRTTAELRETLAEIRRKTDRPFAINLTIGLTDPNVLAEHIELVLEFEVPVLITSYGKPNEIVRRAHEKGMTVFHDVINLKHAKVAEKAGIDAIIAVGAGGGGHAGSISPYVLIPYLKENVRPPIIAAGCISGGRQIAASLALGAEAVYMGTRFIASEEANAAPEYKQMAINGSPEDVVYTDKVSGTFGNFLRKTVPGLAPDDAAVKEGAKRWKEIWSAGQGIALAKEIKPVGQIVEDVMREYHDALAELR